MPEAPPLPPSPWQVAERAALVSAVAPTVIGGLLVRGFDGPVRDEWLRRYRSMLPTQTPFRRIPVNISPGRLTAGLDLAATLRQGQLVVRPGLLVECHQGVVLLSMAERASEFTCATLATVLDTAELAVHRDGFAQRYPASLGVVAFDESSSPEESVSAILQDRLGMWVDLRPISIHDVEDISFDQMQLERARNLWRNVELDDEALKTLCAMALSLGVESIRAQLAVASAARIIAALDGVEEVNSNHLAEAVQLILLPRATRIPAIEESKEEPQSAEELADSLADNDGAESSSPSEPEHNHDASTDSLDDATNLDANLEDLVLQAAVANVPADMLSKIALINQRNRSAKTGRAGELTRSKNRGRPVGSERGLPDSGKRLDLLASLRAAVPWQRLRRESSNYDASTGQLIVVKMEDLHVKRLLQRSDTTTIFVVDASGSAALSRLAEAKGAVETLLAECYTRRDRVALIAFRGSSAELLLPPTRSLVRAKKAIVALPGGGGTPIATAIDSARLLAEQVRREGSSAAVVLLTDGKANVCRDGSTGRKNAMQDAFNSATEFSAQGFRAVLVDTSPRPNDRARELADKLSALYLPLPAVDAKLLSSSIQEVLQ